MNSRYNNVFGNDDDDMMIKTILARIKNDLYFKENISADSKAVPDNYTLTARELIEEMCILIEDLYNIEILMRNDDNILLKFSNGERFVIGIRKLAT